MNILNIKKSLLGAMSLALMFTACNPMDDIYDEHDQDPTFYAPSVEFTLTADDYSVVKDAALENLSEDQADYAYAVKNDGAFNQVVTAADYMKYVLEESYAVLEQGSSATITYNTTVKPEELMKYESATMLELTADDYAVAGDIVGQVGAFLTDATADEHMSDVLNAAYETAGLTASDGDYAYVNYLASEEEPVDGSATIYAYDFADGVGYEEVVDQDGWSQYKVVGTEGWEFREYSGNVYPQMSAYGTDGDVQAYLISPKISLVDGAVLNMDLNYGYYNGDAVDVLISSDFDGSNVESATWNNINDAVTFPEQLSGGYAGLSPAGPIDLSAYSGDIYVALLYTGSGTGVTTTVQLDDFSVSTAGYEVDGKVEYNDVYAFDGKDWAKDEVAIVLDPSDYDMMGAPGSHNSFSSSDAPESYIPTFLAQAMPYAQEGDEYTIVYDYYSGGNSVRADAYALANGVWSSTSTANYIAETSPFFNSSIGWIFDPTVRFTISSDQYQMMVDYVKDNVENGADYVDSYGTSEYVYGNASYYSNIDMRLSKRTSYSVPLTQDEMDEYGVSTWEEDAEKGVEISYNRLKYESLPTLLALAYPNSASEVFGVAQSYEVTFQTYGNDLVKMYQTYQYTCTKAGPDPEFTFEADITE